MSDVAMAWFTPTSWCELCAVAEDELAGSYEAFVHNATAKIAAFEAQGFAVTKVPIDVPHLVAWCTRHGLHVDSKSRAAYGAAPISVDGDRNALDRMGLEGRSGSL
jgi:hypothetical protein